MKFGEISCIAAIATTSVLTLASIACNKNKTETPVATSASAEQWNTDAQKAFELSKKDSKPVLMDFTGSDWCGWCKKLKAEVFDKDEFKDWAAKKVILLEVDFPRQKEQTDAVRQQNEELKIKYEIEGFPTIVFISSDGTEIGRIGYISGGAKAWIAKADEIIKTPR